MREHRIHRLYVLDPKGEGMAGVLAYPDIVGILYRYCHRCEKSLLHRGPLTAAPGGPDQLAVREVMSPQIFVLPTSASLGDLMGALAAYRFGAVPLVTTTGQPLGVVSKTDLILAYLHGLPQETAAQEIMSMPILTCQQEEPLLAVIKRMIYQDLHRIFVYKDRPETLVGVLSLSDAARFRSGSCRACLASRISP
jgi:CBS domain-containing protein